MSSGIDVWGPLTTLGTAAIGASASATLTFNLEAENYDSAILGLQVVFSATVGANTTFDLYRGLSGGDFIDLVSAGQLVATAVTSGTAMLTTLINGYPYVQIVAANGDATSAVDITVVAQGHFEDGLDRTL